MRQYLDLLHKVMFTGSPTPSGAISKSTGKPLSTTSLFGCDLRMELREYAFPLLTSKKVFFRGVVEELCWFLRGSTSVKELQDKDVHIWDDWADERGDIGPGYGLCWRNWDAINQNCTVESSYQGHVDQISEVVDNIEAVVRNPQDRRARRLIVTAWDPYNYRHCALPPCHCLFQFKVEATSEPQLNYLSCAALMRSVDVFLGLPFNIASYALLTHMIAKVVSRRLGDRMVYTKDLVFHLNDAHIYENHLEQSWEQYRRGPGKLPSIRLDDVAHEGRDNEQSFALDLEPGNPLELAGKYVVLGNYNPQPALKAEIAV
jgi:thymidylate synthase